MGIKFNPFSGTFDFTGSGGTSSSPENFSYNLIQVGETITVPLYQEMLIVRDIIVLGNLMVDGLITYVS